MFKTSYLKRTGTTAVPREAILDPINLIEFSRIRELCSKPELLAAALDLLAYESNELTFEEHLEFISVAKRLYSLNTNELARKR